MPVEYRIDKEQRIVFSKAWGKVTGDELLLHQQRLTADPDFRSDMRQLFDASSADASAVPSATMEALAEGNPFGAGARRAVVAPRDLPFGLARMFEAMTLESRDELHVFRSMKEAREWLGLESQDMEPANPVAS